MKKIKVITGIVAVVLIAAMAGFNVSINKQGNKLSAISLANIEALAQGGENTTGWYVVEISSTRKDNGNVVSETQVVECSEGGPSSSCTPSCTTRFKNGNSWTDWGPC
jgi:hypothetical protein